MQAARAQQKAAAEEASLALARELQRQEELYQAKSAAAAVGKREEEGERGRHRTGLRLRLCRCP
eukprot:COSAG03_NODE_6462_length_1056_cov_2.636364_1_plen_63_part_10